MKSFGQQIRDGIYDIFYIFREELTAIFRDSVTLTFFLLVPVVYPLIYSAIYNREKATEVPVVVIDNCQSAQSRDFIFRVDASPEVRVVAHCPDLPHAQEWLARRYAYGIITIPAEFSTDLGRGEQAHVSLYCDMSNLLFYKAIVLSSTEVSLQMGAELQVNKEKHISARQDEVTTAPVLSEHVTLYNPTGGFASFLLPAVLILIIQQTLLLCICMLAGTARERGRYDAFRPMLQRPKGVMRFIIGKSMVYFVLYIAATAYLVYFIPWAFSFPHIGHPGQIAFFLLPYLLSCIFFAMTLSCLVSDRETPMILFVFTSIIFMFLTGASWPIDAFPPVLKWVAYLLPSTHGVQGFIKMNCMGADLTQVAHELHWLWRLTLIYFTTACTAYFISLRRPAALLA